MAGCLHVGGMLVCCVEGLVLEVYEASRRESAAVAVFVFPTAMTLV